MAKLNSELARVIGEIWTSHEMEPTLTEICSFGNRLAGSPGEEQTKNLVIDRLSTAGYTDIHRWAFDYLGWTRGTCQLEVQDSSERRNVRAISLVGSPSTDDSGLLGEIIDLGFGTERDFAQTGDEIAGKIVMVSSGAPPGSIPIHRRAKYGWAVKYGATGFMQMNHQPGGTPLTGSLRPNRPAEVPGISIGHEDGMAIRRQLRAGPVHAKFYVSNSFEERQAENLYVDIPGQTDEIVVLSAHYDGHDISPSAQDNGSGLTTVLELARILAPMRGKLRRTIRIMFFTVEEWALVGSRLFAGALTPEERASYAFVVNLDTTTGLGPKSWVVNGVEELVPFIRQCGIDAGYDWSVREDVLTNSDHFSFLLNGIPGVWLQGTVSSETTPRRFVLSEHDTLDKVSFREMRESAMVTAQLLLRAADHPGEIAPHYSLAQVQAILRSRGLESALKIQEDWPGPA